jgi:integrase
MARSIRSTPLETRSARLRLPVSKAPVFIKLGPKIGLGYRRNQTAGTWVVRLSDSKGRTRTAIGIADDYNEADGEKVLNFWQAQERARQFAYGNDPGSATRRGIPITINQALDQYATDLKIRGGDAGNVTRVKVHLSDTLARRSISLVTTRELRQWRDGLATQLAAATVNRTSNALRAALNLAADHDERITTRRAWETGLAAIHDAEESRNVILDEQAIRALIAVSYEQGEEFGLLAETSAVTGARVSQLARLEVQDLQDARPDPRLTMPSSRKGRGKKKLTRRPVPIPVSLAAKLRSAADGRRPTAPLLTKPGGDRWRKSDHSRPFARAVKAAGLDPGEVTLYALRHSNIVRALLAGVPVRVVAVNHDTSVAMIEKTYSRHIGDHADALARQGLLDFGSARGGNVIPITAAS